MTTRHPFLAAYDVRNPRRLRMALKVLKGYAAGRQKSVFECLLSPAEEKYLLAETEAVLDLSADRFFLIRLDPRAKVRTLGKGVAFTQDDWIYIG